MIDYRCILVPLDGSSLSEQALFRATALAQKFRSDVILLHILNIPMPAVPVPHPEVCTGWKRVALRCARRKAEKYLDEQQCKVRRQGLAVRTLMCDRAPVQGILDVAIREGVDLIVMNGHAQEDLSRWHLGSVAGTVARHSPCPVLLMPSDARGEKE
jgi:nucleotide-binding universal stress UspA family protein